MQSNNVPPPGFKLRRTISASKVFHKPAWSPDGRRLAVANNNNGNKIDLFDTVSGTLLQTLTHPTLNAWGSVNSISWSPDGQRFVSSNFKELVLGNAENGQILGRLTGQFNNVNWSPDGKMLACVKYDYDSDEGIRYGSTKIGIELRDIQSGQLLQTLGSASTLSIVDLAWSPTSKHIAVRFDDSTIQLWDIESRQRVGRFGVSRARGWGASSLSDVAWSPGGRVLTWGDDTVIQLFDIETGQTSTLEGHTTGIKGISFSFDGSLLASLSIDGIIRFWYANPRETVATIKHASFREDNHQQQNDIAFSPTALTLAELDEEGQNIRIWDLDLTTILLHAPAIRSVCYTNAKVVLLGESGAGKSGLALTLTNQHFVATDSTHGRHVWQFESNDVLLRDGRKMTRETLLWDLAGQPGYRLIHQLHLNEIAVALVVFDARSETDPFASVYHWNRALEQAQRVQGSPAPAMKKFLVAARIDRGGIGVSRERINALMKDLGFDGYFETSAKAGWGISDLQEAIRRAIPWDTLPWVSSTELFQRIKDFLVAEKEAGRLLSTSDDLYFTFLRTHPMVPRTEDLRAQFETCIGRVESRDLIRRLSFGKLVLLQPELLDTYASALVNAVRDEPDGLGSIAEEQVLACTFKMSAQERIADREQEKLLLIAMVEDLLRYEIALREQTDETAYLIFPSQSTRENPDLPEPEGKAAVFSFEGPVLNVYATLAVRLSHSGLFKMKELWKNAMTYSVKSGGMCGMFLQDLGEGRAELMLFFDKGTSEEMCFHFDEYVEAHLKRRALPESVKRRRVFVCSECGYVIDDRLVARRIARGIKQLTCPDCEKGVILLLDKAERLPTTPHSRIVEMDQEADKKRVQQTAQTSLQGKIETNDFDVFLCHNQSDKEPVRGIGNILKEKGLLPWLDEWELRPGLPWQRALEQQIGHIKSAAVFVGSNGIGPWQQNELEAFLSEFVRRGCPIIPVLLPDAPQQPQLPLFLKNMTWVDFRKQRPDPLERLIWGITGVQVRSPLADSFVL